MNRNTITTIIYAIASLPVTSSSTLSLNLSYTAPAVEPKAPYQLKIDEPQLEKKEHIEWKELEEHQHYVEQRIDPVSGEVTYEKYHTVITP